MRVVFTPLAERQIDALHEYISAQSGEARADGYVGRIVTFCLGLAIFPERGVRRDDIMPGLRVTGFERRVMIAFLVAAEVVLVEGIFYGSGFCNSFGRLKWCRKVVGYANPPYGLLNRPFLKYSQHRWRLS